MAIDREIQAEYRAKQRLLHSNNDQWQKKES